MPTDSEAAARGAHVDNIVCLNPRIDVRCGGAMRFPLDAQAKKAADFGFLTFHKDLRRER
jgi:hypothetical protein